MAHSRQKRFEFPTKDVIIFTVRAEAVNLFTGYLVDGFTANGERVEYDTK